MAEPWVAPTIYLIPELRLGVWTVEAFGGVGA